MMIRMKIGRNSHTLELKELGGLFRYGGWPDHPILWRDLHCSASREGSGQVRACVVDLTERCAQSLNLDLVLARQVRAAG